MHGRSQDRPTFIPMNKRRPNLHEDEGEIIVIGESAPPQTPARRILRWCGEVVMWVLVIAPGVLIIAYGASGIRNERLVGVAAIKCHLTLRTRSAGGIFVALGFWTLGQFCYLKTGCLLFRFAGWVFAVGACGVGLWVLASRFVQ